MLQKQSGDFNYYILTLFGIYKEYAGKTASFSIHIQKKNQFETVKFSFEIAH